MKRYYLENTREENLVAIIFKLHKNSKKECLNIFMGTETVKKRGWRLLVLNEDGRREVLSNEDYINLFNQKIIEKAQFCYPQ